MKLPNAENAFVAIEKLRDYSLSPEHDEGKHKARVFRAALGFTQSDAERLRQMALDAARTGEATPGKTMPYGQMYVLSFDAQGPHGVITIRTAWIIVAGTDFPRLVTCYVR